MSELLNLLVDLDDGFANDEGARETIARAGLAREVTGYTSDRVLAWIDDAFGGAWSSEVAAGAAVIASRAGAPAGFAAFDVRGFDYAWLRGIAREPGVGIFGPFGVDEAYRGTHLGTSLLHCALVELRQRGYTRALIAATNGVLAPYYERHAGARIVERFDTEELTARPVRTVVLASGSGTNFQAVLDAVREKKLPLDVRALVTNRSDAGAIERARRDGVPVEVLSWKRAEQKREAYDAALCERVAGYEPELVLLLGWMHLLDPAFIDAFPATLNVHPAYLPLDPARDRVGLPDGSEMPAFRGAYAVRDAFAAQSAWIGASVHQVTAQTDRGRIYARRPLRLLPGEDTDAALIRLHPIEHALVLSAIRRWLYER